MKVVAKRSFSGGLDEEASKLGGPRRERKFVRKQYFRNKEYVLDKKDAEQYIRNGWMSPVKGGSKAEVTNKDVDDAPKETKKDK